MYVCSSEGKIDDEEFDITSWPVEVIVLSQNLLNDLNETIEK